MPFQPTILPVDIGSSATISVSSGNFGGFTAMLQNTPTVTATAYAAGQCVGGLIALSGASRTAGGSGLIQSVAVSFLSGVQPSVDVVFFNANPTASTITNNTALAINAADVGKVVGVAHLSDITLLGASSPSFIQATGLALPFVVSTGTILYCALVIRSSASLTSVSDATLTVRVLQD